MCQTDVMNNFELSTAPVNPEARTAHTDAILASLKKARGNKPFILVVSKPVK